MAGPPMSIFSISSAAVTPGVVMLCGEDAPTRMILCAGAGHFAQANITLTEGILIGGGTDAPDRVRAAWPQIVDRTGEIVPAYGFAQAERELASAGGDSRALGARA